DGPSRQAILDFVERVTREGSADFVPPSERIAAFDNDGTLWAEQPMYTQAAFALDRVRELAPRHPDWRDREPFRSVLDGDPASIATSGERGIVDLLVATHVGNTTDEFANIVT